MYSLYPWTWKLQLILKQQFYSHLLFNLNVPLPIRAFYLNITGFERCFLVRQRVFSPAARILRRVVVICSTLMANCRFKSKLNIFVSILLILSNKRSCSSPPPPPTIPLVFTSKETYCSFKWCLNRIHSS